MIKSTGTKGNGDVVSQERESPDFTGVVPDGIEDVIGTDISNVEN